MEVDDEEMEQPTSSSKGEKKRFEVKKVKIASHPGTSLSLSLSNPRLFPPFQWNAVALWAWGMSLHTRPFV